MQKQLKLENFNTIEILRKEFLNRKISILQDGYNGKESYTGICIEITPDGIFTEILSNSKYELHYIRHSHVISILRYNEANYPIY